MPGPLDMIGVLARQELEITESLRHLEIYTMEGLLSVLAHGPKDASSAVVMCGGAMGGLLGPAGGLFHRLGERLAAEGIQSLRVDYRKANDLNTCVLDTCAIAQLASQTGAERFVMIGHSFGGAVAINASLSLPAFAAGTITLSSQSAGCERIAELAPKPLLMFHGDEDQILPASVSETLRDLSGGHGDLRILAGADHLLTSAAAEIETELMKWIPTTLVPR